jgi:hypothetical protein
MKTLLLVSNYYLPLHSDQGNLRKKTAHHDKTHEHTVSSKVARCISLAVGEGSNQSSHVTETNVHSDTDGTLGGSSDVVSVPCNSHRDTRVDTTGGQEDSEVLDVRVDGSEQHGESGHGDNAASNHVQTTLLLTVGVVSSGNGAGTGSDVGRDRHQLGVLIGVSHTLDDGGKEERDRVQGGVDA